MISSRQIESLRAATRELVTYRRGESIPGTLSLAALVFETSTDHDAEAIYEFLVTLERTISDALNDDEEDD